ncbi:Mycolic acid cyclopropane synthetase-domain-containing protein, partial [Irpex rosettiformis]
MLASYLVAHYPQHEDKNYLTKSRLLAPVPVSCTSHNLKSMSPGGRLHTTKNPHFHSGNPSTFLTHFRLHNTKYVSRKQPGDRTFNLRCARGTESTAQRPGVLHNASAWLSAQPTENSPIATYTMSLTHMPMHAPSKEQLLSPNDSSSTTSLSSRQSWFASFARSSISSFMSTAISTGYLQIEEDGENSEYGDRSAPNVVRVRILNQNFWRRVLFTGDLGFGEAYMLGEIEIDNLQGIMRLWLDNQQSFSELSTRFSRFLSFVSSLANALFGQTKFQARLNAITSYDQSNDLFQAFLSKEMMYSCALWGEGEGGVNGDLISGPFPGDLESAQSRKIHYILKKARVEPGHRILEFGSGWGGLAIEAARVFGCEVDSLTLSREQKSLAEERIKAAGLDDKIRIHLLDYRDIPTSFKHAFDAFVSIEMLEHVGSRHYNEYFSLVNYALKPSNATVVVTSSTFPESRYTGFQAQDFMRKYMWPNSCLPSATALINAAYAGAGGRFTLEGVENHAAHYPRTLRTWDRRLKENLKQEVMTRSYPSLSDPLEYAIFKRKWQYFFAYAGEGFVNGYITCHMLTFIRTNDVSTSM